MRVFIALKVPRGNTERLRLSWVLAAEARRAGHTPFVGWQEIVRRRLVSPNVFMPFIRQNIRLSGLFWLAYHPELRGGLIEAGMAYAFGVPVWLLYPAGQEVSSSALGCANRLIAYTNLDDLADQLRQALKI